ncbi:pyrophosphatase PpaX [Clostridium sp. HBUAS56017]|uniref:pyrophosphatase PpaX n=1 Tax=Clostridium sp. HBUAS56017 TaxID=2571128 RepID=UPI001178218B|nr:pyrophosphatase PpaX [Clostridium sp. HBUAS56017]
MIKAVLFDLDGTLLDTNDLIYDSFCRAFKEVLDIELPKEEITLLYGKPLKTSLIKYTDNEDLLENLINSYRNYNKVYHDNMCRPFEGVKELLLALKERAIKIGIVTSKRKELAKRGLELGELIGYMDVIISPEDTIKHKPEGDPALKACEMLGVLPKEAIMVGDSPYDLLCGKNAGCLTCGVEYTALQLSELIKIKPSYLIKKPLDLLELI